MANSRVLITTTNFEKMGGDNEQRLRDAGHEVVWGTFTHAASEDELLPVLAGIDAVLAGSDHFTRKVLEQAPTLKVISRFGVGYDAIDVAAATGQGIWVTTTPGTNELSVADMALTLILALARQLLPLAQETSQGQWNRRVGCELAGKTLGLIGFGRIGRQVALRARAFGMAILVSDVVRNEAAAAEVGARYASLEEVLAQSDFVSLHAPATPETRNLINQHTLSQMKPSAFLINTARGDLVEEHDLAAALQSGKLAGAGLDVFKHEPPGADHPLLHLPNVIALPHIAGITEQAGGRMADLSVDNILAVLRGERPPYPVNDPPQPRNKK